MNAPDEMSEKSEVAIDVGSQLHVACAADDNYAMPLAVTIASAARTLSPAYSLQVHLLDGNISVKNRTRLKQTAEQHGVTLHWIQADFSLLDDLQISHHISHVAYYRLLLSRMLPERLDRVLYLDSDLLVQQSISEIWNLEFNENSLWAAPDIACPFINAAAVATARKARPYMAVWRPVPNYRQLGIDPTAQYFNSGVLLIDLARWRDESMCRQFIDCLRDNQSHVWCWDQYALNVVMAGKWQPLESAWNQGAHVFEYPDSDCSPIEREQFLQMRDHPKIVHFTTEWKPWHFVNDHPLRDAFFETIDETAWAGWRPERPPFRLRKWFDKHGAGAQKRITIAWRKLANLWT